SPFAETSPSTRPLFANRVQKEEAMSTTTERQAKSNAASSKSGGREIQYWVTSRRGAVEIAAFSNAPHNYLTKAVIDELEQLVALKDFIAVDPESRRDWFESE